MKRLYMKICSIVLVFVIFFSPMGYNNPVLNVFGNASPNLISNGDFELDPASTDSWLEYSNPVRSTASFTWDDQVYHGNGTGSHSLQISGHSVSAFYTTEVPILPNKEYSLSAWGTGLNITTVNDEIGSYIYCLQYDNSGNPIKNTSKLFYMKGTFGWALAKSTIVANANATSMSVTIGLDGSGYVWYDDVSLSEVAPAATPATGIQIPDGAVITDTVMHPSQPIMYAVDSKNSKLYAINYQANIITSAAFDLQPERIEFSNDKLYVTLLKAPHTSSTDESYQRGAVEIINPIDLSVIKRIDINTDPFDIVVDRDYIYIPSGSGQWTSIKSYSETSGALLSSDAIRQQSYAEFNSQLNRIYTIDTDSSPRDYEAYDVADGIFSTTSHDSPYHGDYPMNKNFRLSPDGNYLFNGSGLILKCDAAKDMFFAYMLDTPFNDIAFDTLHNKFYTGVAGKTVYSYEYGSYSKAKTYSSQEEICQLYYRDNKLIALSRKTGGQYIVEQIDVSDNAEVPVQVVANKQLTKADMKLKMDYNVRDAVMHPANPIMYVADAEHNKIASINYSTGTVIETGTGDSPGSIAYLNGELIVGFGNQGKVDIYDSVTMLRKDTIYTGATFFDMTVGRDGYIYTISRNYTRSYSRAMKQEVSSIPTYHQGYLETDPTRNSLLMTSVYVSPMDLYVIQYNDGALIKKYDSPYHGDYDLTPNSKISPDGNYIFNGSGNIFLAANMIYDRNLGRAFEDVAFDLETGRNRFYIAARNNTIHVYDYATFGEVGGYNTIGEVQKLYRVGNELIAIVKLSNTNNAIEIYNLLVPMDSYNTARQSEILVEEDLTISANMEAADLAVTAASTALSKVTDETVRVGLNHRVTAVQAKIAQAKAAILAVEDLEIKSELDLRIEANLIAAETVVEAANAAVIDVAPGTTRSTLDNRLINARTTVTTARKAYDAAVAAVAAATIKVNDLETAAAKDLTVLSNLTAAEAALSAATIAVNALGDGIHKNELLSRINAARATVTTAREAYDAAVSVAVATIKVNDLETAAAKDLTVLSNLTAAEAAVTAATTAVNALGDGIYKNELLSRINAARTTVTTAREAYDAAQPPAGGPPSPPPPPPVFGPTPPPAVVPATPTADPGVIQGANIVKDAASGIQPIKDATPINNAVNQAVKSLISDNENTQTANINIVVTQIISNASAIAAKITDATQKESFLTATTNAIAAVTTAAATVKTEANAIELAKSFKTISLQINTLTNVTVNTTTQQQLVLQQTRMTDTMQTVVSNVIASAGTVKTSATVKNETITVALNQADMLTKADKVVDAATNLNTAIVSSGLDVAIEKKLVLEVAASAIAKNLNIECPASMLEQMQAKGIEAFEIQSGIAKINVAPDFITKSKDTKTITLEVQKIALTDDFRNSMNVEAKALLQSTGEIYDFNAILKDTSGVQTTVTNFNSDIEVSLPYSIKAGENKQNITVFYLADDGTVKNMAGVYDEATGSVKFKTNHFSKYLINNNVVQFSDITEQHWAKKEIEVMASKGIISGSLGKYLPNNNVSRAEFTKLITTALNIVDDNATTNLKDVKNDAWYYKYVASAVKAGIISEKNGDTFAPNEAITRQDMAIMLANAMTKVKGETSISGGSNYLSSFVDEDSITDDAVDAFATVIKYKLMGGKPGNKVDPLGKTTRAEAATVIYRLFYK